MNRTRSIRLFFFFLVAGILVFFWIGYAYGSKTQQKKDQIEIAKLQNEQQSFKQQIAEAKERADEADRNATASTAENPSGTGNTSDAAAQDADAVTTSGTLNQKAQFYLKDAKGYLVVYVSATDEVYFETDVKTTQLPTDLQEEVLSGIPFYNLQDLYNFLENYSS